MNYDLKIIQGNTKTFRITCDTRDFTMGDKITFSVKQDKESEETILKKEVSLFDGNVAVVELSPDDTAKIPFGNYVYDFQFDGYDGAVKTIYKGNLYLDWRVTDDE